jgi:hypothetical protein
MEQLIHESSSLRRWYILGEKRWYILGENFALHYNQKNEIVYFTLSYCVQEIGKKERRKIIELGKTKRSNFLRLWIVSYQPLIFEVFTLFTDPIAIN